jgi:hypothetical protein
MVTNVSELNGRSMAQAVSHWPLTLSPGIALKSVHVEFLVDTLLLEQSFLRVLRFFSVGIIPLGLCIRMSPGGWTTGPLAATDQIQFHPIDVAWTSYTVYHIQYIYNSSIVYVCVLNDFQTKHWLFL